MLFTKFKSVSYRPQCLSARDDKRIVNSFSFSRFLTTVMSPEMSNPDSVNNDDSEAMFLSCTGCMPRFRYSKQLKHLTLPFLYG